MRLDIFLPFLRKPKKNLSAPIELPIYRLAKTALPQTLFADRATAKPGLIRKALKWIGPSWLSSPVRRVVQIVCFAVLLWLLFYVCFPYHAKPAQRWRNLSPQAFGEGDQVAVEAAVPGAFVDGPSRGQIVHISDEGRPEASGRYLGPFYVAEIENRRLLLRPSAEVSADRLEELRFDSGGPWTIDEVKPDAWPAHYTRSLEHKEWIPAESLLIIDPLVAISTAIAARSWVWSLAFAGGILLVGVLVPRGFCGYICPLGTLIDLFDWAIGKRVTRFRVPDDGWWVHIKYYLLTGVLLCSFFGVLVSGYVAAIPVITRGFVFLADPFQIAAARGWHNVPPLNSGHFVSIALFFAVLGLGFFKPRFWCKYVCPSGAVFSIGNLFRVSERKVESSCINCNKCVEICPFDAIKPDFTTRTSDCTLCQTCGGVCPTHAIKFVERWNGVELKVENDPPTRETALGRRGFVSLLAGSAFAVVGAGAATAATKVFGARLDDVTRPLPIRPPGSVPEQEFLEMCIRCGECFKACPNNVLQPLAFQQGLEGLWTPAVHADWAGCESSCNACTQVCPTGAIRAISLEEKKVARIGLAIVDQRTCLPHAGREACQLCVDECVSAGYRAIEFVRVGTEVDELGLPIEGSGFAAPLVRDDLCVGCGLCQTRCFAINVAGNDLLKESAVIVRAGEGREDRLLDGSYLALREAEHKERLMLAPTTPASEAAGDDYLPDFLK
jgi:ferredoxin